MVKDNLEDLAWDSLEPYAIFLALLFIGFYSLINILVPFQKKEMKKSGRIIMITLHNIILLVILIFSFNQYTFMNPINIVINILMLVTIVYLIAYHIIKLK